MTTHEAMERMRQLFGEAEETDRPLPSRRVKCCWCGESIWLQVPSDVRKFCVDCSHQGALERGKCGCARCVIDRLDKRGITVDVLVVPR